MEEGDQFNENAFRKTNPNFSYILFILSKKALYETNPNGCKIMKKQNEAKFISQSVQSACPRMSLSGVKSVVPSVFAKRTQIHDFSY